MTVDAHRFPDRTAVVVGGAHGIGRAAAERLADEGATVIVADLDPTAAEAVRDALPGDREHAAVRLDVTDPDDVLAAAARIGELAPRLDTVVHAAGGATPHGSFEETPDEIWTRMFDLNTLGDVRVARALVPLLRRGSGNRSFVFVASVNGIHVLGEQPYSVAKAALISLTHHLAAQFAPDGIRVNAVAPGTVRTRVWDGQPGGADRMLPLYPLGRVGEPADIAAAIAFLASDDASWVTGHVLPVDGGLAIAVPDALRRAADAET